ncbi:MAG: aldehyde dehydrogenase family protein [Sphingobacteriales bacterium]|jgi:aldehyde dehydrogenase (NAD+)|nr:aldehyde dehydrogenase family protein [Sphingobacteriales bacterium]MBP9140637.1 aldehyde dehydrogenase family protein [Chitinophagales bacterium]MBK6889069.1 aldehyde dehydrogenase family protein [Sphingobacteriales bacterium]MBK7528428.1 aldehyde dehydrogenase family protein [Sphingobacteriales bacterium]MBK8679610.1 aldehyde dehydrogenase family protein [Sphingobacteriales bacterium]
MNIQEFLHELNLDANNYGTSTGSQWLTGSGNYLASHSPVNGQLIANAEVSTAQNYGQVIQTAQQAYAAWRTWPAPRRGEVVRQYGNLLREHKNALGHLVSYEMGKSLQEGLGEVQEMIDICDFAVGLSRQLYGLTMHSERPMHRMYEQWHPLGIIGIISAFNFPVAVWSWNAAIAWVCGNVCVWKPSEKTPLTAIACQKLAAQVFANNDVPDGVSCLIMGNYEVGQWLTSDERVPLISATGSTRMGKLVGQTVAGRLGRSLLELGGNNAIIISESANMQLLVGAVFGAVGTCGQRCTTTRRLIIHGSVYEKVKTALIKAYNQLRIGNPLDANNHVGPLIDLDAVKNYLAAIEAAKQQGGRLLVEGGVLSGAGYESGCYVKPCIIEMDSQTDIVRHETFAPILYLLKYDNTIEEAIQLQNEVPQGLSSAIMTNNLMEAEQFLSHKGSDCGIANVNIGTSGAEIGGAFGGEKETGGGRESGSDAWKAYMRRQTNTINYSSQLPLAQGIKFEL